MLRFERLRDAAAVARELGVGQDDEHEVETPWIIAEVMDRFDDETLTEADLHVPDRSNQLSLPLWPGSPKPPAPLRHQVVRRTTSCSSPPEA